AGTVQYLSEEPDEERKPLEKEVAQLQGKEEHEEATAADKLTLIAKKKELDDLTSRWSGNITWAKVGGKKDQTWIANALQVGYHIDHLALAMFLMVTFIGTLIHVFSIGYMSEELQTTVEDHQVHGENGHLRRRGRFGRFFLFMSLFSF